MLKITLQNRFLKLFKFYIHKIYQKKNLRNVNSGLVFVTKSKKIIKVGYIKF